MAITNNISNIHVNKELSIQVSLSGLSFCILQKDTNTIAFLNQITFEKKLNPFEVLDRLKHEFNTQDALKSSFSAVNVVHVNELSTLVPKPLFVEDNLADYLKFNSKILKSDFITFDDIALNDSVNVYVPYMNINNYVYDTFGSFTYKHVSTVLIEDLLSMEKNAEDLKIYVNVETDCFEVVTIDKGELLFYNTFEYSTKEDFIYYLLFTAEQLQLNPETLQLFFLGAIDKDDELYKIAYKYIRHIRFGDRQDGYKYNIEPKTLYSNFALIKSF